MPELPPMTPEAQKAYDEALRRIEVCRQQGKNGTELNLNGLGLTTLPPEIGQLIALTELLLYSNQLTTLPPKIGQLTALTMLSLDSNQLTTLPPEIGQLTALTMLFLGTNQLTTLPPEIGQLTALTMLFLGTNQLTTLPPEIGQLIALTELLLYSNQLTTLPPEIGQLTALTELYLHGNPALGLPAEVLGPPRHEGHSGKNPAAKPQAILDHYFALQTQGERPLNEVRLVLVGRGGAGKTSLVQRLVKNRFDPAEEETPGIALSDWVMKDCTGEPVTAHVWDFAGQMITHSMHRYFLSHRTVYLLVLTQREDMAGDDAEYWLKLMASYGTETHADGSRTSPPVLVVLNKSDQAAVKVDQGALKERHPSILGFVETDCRSGRGIEELRRKLCALMDDPQVKPWVRQGYPKMWWDVKEAIRRVQQEKPHVTYDEWREICRRCGVTDNAGQDAASRDLHTLGVALNYADDERLHDNTVLRPNWVTHHCYNLIRHAQRHQGELRRAELADVLGAGEHGEHDPKMHTYLMRLMERFEAAYPLGESWPPTIWLIPLGLPDNQPGGVEVFGKVPPAAATRLRYTYSAVPSGLLAQFIVRTHPLLEPQMQWASGTVLTLNEARALVRAVSKTEVEITVINGTPDTRRDLAGLCREELRSLHAQISGLDVKERTEVVAGGERVWASVRTLEQDELKGKTASGVETDQGTLEVETKKELDEFGTEAFRLPSGLRIIGEGRLFHAAGTKNVKTPTVGPLKPIVFISYSHKDERHRKTLELHLEVLKINGLIHKVWHDRRIQPGMDWDQKIQTELEQADVVLFLTSTASLASGYINQDELRPALERYAKKKSVVVPIILERCAWVDTFAASPPLQQLTDPTRRVPQALPYDGRPLNEISPRSIGWGQVAEGLKKLLTEVKTNLVETWGLEGD
jgi:internalin A